MNIILCHPQDKDAIWLYMELKKMKLPIELISPEQLLMADEWTQNITTESDDFYIKLKNGITIKSSDSHFLFNRTQFAMSPIWNKADKNEKNYVQAEMNALLISWLYQMQQKNTIYNPSVGYSLSGVYWTDQEWESAAYKSGFENVKIDSSYKIPYDSLLVVGNKVISNIIGKKEVKNAISLSKIANTPILEIRISKNAKQFIGANSFPSLQQYGNKLIALIQNEML